MSDLDKVVSYATRNCASRKIKLRWEGAGYASHAISLLCSLRDKKIPFDAQIHIYEGADSIQVRTACESLGRYLPQTDDTPYEARVFYGANVMREHTSSAQMDFIFVRNIMPTSGRGDSRTTDEEMLDNIHFAALRNRRHSLSEGGRLEIGMSGAPGLVAASGRERDAMRRRGDKSLFENMAGLREAGAGLILNRKITYDDSVNLMKNDGRSLGRKPTYYLTFVKPVSASLPASGPVITDTSPSATETTSAATGSPETSSTETSAATSAGPSTSKAKARSWVDVASGVV